MIENSRDYLFRETTKRVNPCQVAVARKLCCRKVCNVRTILIIYKINTLFHCSEIHKIIQVSIIVAQSEPMSHPFRLTTLNTLYLQSESCKLSGRFVLSLDYRYTNLNYQIYLCTNLLNYLRYLLPFSHISQFTYSSYPLKIYDKVASHGSKYCKIYES